MKRFIYRLLTPTGLLSFTNTIAAAQDNLTVNTPLYVVFELIHYDRCGFARARKILKNRGGGE